MKEDKKILIIFIIVISLLFLLFIYNDYLNRRELIDRKVIKIFNKYNYNEIIEKSNNTFLNAIRILNTNNLDYAMADSTGVMYFTINDNFYYRKINNFYLISNTLREDDLEKYMNDKKIIIYENNYYIDNYKDSTNEDYIGSIIDLIKYDDKYLYFKSNNYYCSNYEYIGLLEEEPNCNYTNTETNFKLVFEDNNIKINDLEEIKQIIA